MDRSTFSTEWFKRGENLLNKFEETENTGFLFESYIYLWISLTISVKQYWACDDVQSKIASCLQNFYKMIIFISLILKDSYA